MTAIFLFPGQGAQRVGMGAQLFEKYPALTQQANEVLGYSLVKLCIEDTHKQLDETAFTQPALYFVNALSLIELQEEGIVPAFAAGHSLGEYCALYAAGVFDLITGLKIVKKRGELMGAVRGGGMAAVIGLNEEAVRGVLVQERLSDLDIANLNAPRQIVISGPAADVARAERPLISAGAKHFVVLKVSAAFHSRYMQGVEREFREYLRQFPLSKPRFPVVSNADAAPYPEDGVLDTLSRQISHPVRWTDSIRLLMAQPNPEFREVGPGQILSGLVQQIRADAGSAPARVEPARRERSSGTFEREPRLFATNLGSAAFRQEFGVSHSYVAGSMYRGISSEQMVIALARAGFLAFFGAGGLSLSRTEQAVRAIQKALGPDCSFGVNLLHNLNRPDLEQASVEAYLRLDVRVIEASAFMQMTPALVQYRAKGLRRRADGSIEMTRRLIGKVSRPEVAQAFLSPAPDRLLRQLVTTRKITEAEAELAASVPMADALTIEADSGGHTDQGVALVLLPTIVSLRDSALERLPGSHRVHIGMAGGLGTPHALAAVFVMGADYVLTGSINQCTIESGASSAVKDLLAEAGVQDTTMAPAGDMFEIGARVQVLRRGLFFPSRANRLYEIYKRFQSIDEIDEKTRRDLESKYFLRSIPSVYEETKAYFASWAPEEIERAEANPKHKLALILRWYFGHSTRLAAAGSSEHRVDYQIHCGPAMGAFNAWVKGTELEQWQNRGVVSIATRLLEHTALLLEKSYSRFRQAASIERPAPLFRAAR